jgi:hypothetical protein
MGKEGAEVSMSDIYTTAPVPTASQSYEIGRAHGIKAEQQRIIKLLKAECDCDFYEKYEIPSKCVAHKHIALIKGEK